MFCSFFVLMVCYCFLDFLLVKFFFVLGVLKFLRVMFKSWFRFVLVIFVINLLLMIHDVFYSGLLESYFGHLACENKRNQKGLVSG